MILQRIAAVAAVVLVLAGVVLAFTILGSPARARLIAIDAHRASDLYAIETALHARYGEPGERLPAALSGLVKTLPFGNGLRDPVTHKPYAYRRLTSYRYVLCADFATASDPSFDAYAAALWRHSAAGRRCRTIDVRRNA